MRKARNDPSLDHIIVTGCYDDWYCVRCLPCCIEWCPTYRSYEHINFEGNQLSDDARQTLHVSLSGSEYNVTAFLVAKVAQARQKRLEGRYGAHHRGIGQRYDHAAAGSPYLLRMSI